MTHDDSYIAHYFRWLASTIKNKFEQEPLEVAEFEVIESTPLKNRQGEQAEFQSFPWQPLIDEVSTEPDDLDISVIRCLDSFYSTGMPPFYIHCISGA